jgi:hypothetical protein
MKHWVWRSLCIAVAVPVVWWTLTPVMMLAASA